MAGLTQVSAHARSGSMWNVYLCPLVFHDRALPGLAIRDRYAGSQPDEEENWCGKLHCEDVDRRSRGQKVVLPQEMEGNVKVLGVCGDEGNPGSEAVHKLGRVQDSSSTLGPLVFIRSRKRARLLLPLPPRLRASAPQVDRGAMGCFTLGKNSQARLSTTTILVLPR